MELEEGGAQGEALGVEFEEGGAQGEGRGARH